MHVHHHYKSSCRSYQPIKAMLGHWQMCLNKKLAVIHWISLHKAATYLIRGWIKARKDMLSILIYVIKKQMIADAEFSLTVWSNQALFYAFPILVYQCHILMSYCCGLCPIFLLGSILLLMLHFCLALYFCPSALYCPRSRNAPHTSLCAELAI